VQVADSHIKNYPAPEMIQKVYQAICNYGQIAIGTGEGSSLVLPNLFDFSRQFELTDIYAALKILVLEEYLDFQEQNTSHSKVQFLLSRESLMFWIRKNTIFATLIRTLVRFYPNILSESVLIYENQLAHVLKKSSTQIIDSLHLLQEQQIIDFQAGGQKNTIYFLKDRLSSAFFHLRKDRYFARKEDALFKMKAMQRYVQSKTCRSVFLLSYFGEHHSAACGICDECYVPEKVDLKEEKKRFLAWTSAQEKWGFQDLQTHFSQIDILILENWIDELILKEKIFFRDWWFFKEDG